jgi:hypothetical protein
MNLTGINNLFEECFSKDLHVELKLSLKREQYTQDFISHFHNKLFFKTIKLSHLIGTPIDNERWTINNDCLLVMNSIPKKEWLTNNKIGYSSTICLHAELSKYLSRASFQDLNFFFGEIVRLFQLDLEELYATMLAYNTDNHIKKNIAELTNACYISNESDTIGYCGFYG